MSQANRPTAWPLFLPALLPLLLSACATAARTGAAPSDTAPGGAFGASVRGALAAQVLAPGAGANTDPVAGIDAASALGAQARYRKSYVDETPQANAFTIGVSGK